jgi:hypothetical protein
MGWRKGIDPPFWWKPWLLLPSLREWRDRERPVRKRDVRAMRPVKLLPFPWVFATRKTARRLIGHCESLSRIIKADGREMDRLRGIAGEDRWPRRPACPECGRPGRRPEKLSKDEDQTPGRAAGEGDDRAAQLPPLDGRPGSHRVT